MANGGGPLFVDSRVAVKRVYGNKATVARKLRIQFGGALYHVINRGNYRRDLFETARDRSELTRMNQQAAA